MRPNEKADAMQRFDGPDDAAPPTAASADRQAADLLAEERSEDDGMREHADKASDPVRWAARRDASRGAR
jgi:hypothetical protein